jgi:uncharacterized protein YbjT (DUF2867 family)
MNILVCGATGFVGRNLTVALRDAGYKVVRAVRKPTEADDIAVDFRNDIDKETWLPRLNGIDVVINAVGLLRDSAANPMQKLHSETPQALYAACIEAGVERIVHLSALGVDSGVEVPYFTTRLSTEQVLRQLPPDLRWLCLRPSVIYGKDGDSARMFRLMASLPVQVLPMGGMQTLQPVHIDDVCAAIVRWLAKPDADSRIVAAVGEEPTTMRGMLDSYREQLRKRPACHVAMPRIMVRMAARIGDYIPASPMCSDTYAMLAAGNTADVAQFAELLGQAPRSYQHFVTVR